MLKNNSSNEIMPFWDRQIKFGSRNISEDIELISLNYWKDWVYIFTELIKEYFRPVLIIYKVCERIFKKKSIILSMKQWIMIDFKILWLLFILIKFCGFGIVFKTGIMPRNREKKTPKRLSFWYSEKKLMLWVIIFLLSNFSMLKK